MFVVIHVLFAIVSIAFATGLVIAPVLERFKIAYGLIGGTLVTGIGLVAVSHSDLLSACKTGVAYLVVASSVLAFARLRLAHQNEQ